MRACLFLLIPILAVAIGACRRDQYNPSNNLNAEEQARLVREMVYYATKLPPNASDFDKFDPKYNWYYDRAAAECSLIKFSAATDENTWYYLLARNARSITPMKEGIAGKVKLNADGSLADYDEVFRIWKMNADTLNVRGAMLFDRMVRGKDLSIFYPKFQGDKFIELPNDTYYFDKLTKRWKSAPPQ